MCEKVNTENYVEEHGRTFSAAYESFSAVTRKEIYRKIMDWTEWSRYTFYAKKNGVHPLKPLEAKILELIFLEYGVDAWTGKEVTVTV